MTRGPSPKTAAILQPFETETYLGVKTLTCFDEFIDMQQGTCFHRKKSEPQQFGALMIKKNNFRTLIDTIFKYC